MPRLRYLLDVDRVPPLTGLAARIRRLHEWLSEMALENRSFEPPRIRPGTCWCRAYADGDRGCGGAVALADSIEAVGVAAAAEMGGGWMPVGLVDLETGEQFPIALRPVFGGGRAPVEARARALREVAELATACEYDAEADYTGDALIDYKDGLEDRLLASVAAGLLS